MRKIVVIGLLLINFAFASYSQRVYSKQYLEQATHEDLNFHLKKAKTQKIIGAILTVTGPVLFITYLELINNGKIDIETAEAMYIY